MLCSPVNTDQAGGMLPVTRESPSKLRKDSVDSVDQDAGRLPEKPPSPTSSETRVLTWSRKVWTSKGKCGPGRESVDNMDEGRPMR